MIFFEETGCRENTVGSLALPSTTSTHNLGNLACFGNEEPDAVLLSHEFPCSGKISLCYDPSDCLKGDMITVYLKKPLAENQVYCVRSFEGNFEDDWVKVVYASIEGNRSDRVSRIEVTAADPLNGEEHDATFQCTPRMQAPWLMF